MHSPSSTFLLLLLSFGLISSCTQHPPMKQKYLHEGWTFKASDDQIWREARVPGTVHGDLYRNEMIPDYMIGLNEDSVQWVEEKDWEYRTQFTLTEDWFEQEEITLVFEGLDTYVEVFLNEQQVLSEENMFRTFEISCKDKLVEGVNSLRIYFHSPVNKGQEKFDALPYPIPATNELAPQEKRTSVHSRKAPYHYGWDWGPRIVTSGIWRNVYLRAWHQADIQHPHFILKKLTQEQASYECSLAISSQTTTEVALVIKANEKEFSRDILLQKGQTEYTLPFNIQSPSLWWPNGKGEQTLYPITIEVRRRGKVLASHEERIGIRKIELVQEADEKGRGFYFKVNDQPIFIKGANYIPTHNLLPEVTEADYRRVLQSAVDANMNMLRVWGGAVYENDLFYDLCDEYGILVWQDFMFACAMYPGDPAFLENVRAEATDNIIRLRNHPSLALWCGNNENLGGWYRWNWQETHELDVGAQAELWKAYEDVFYDVLPATIDKYDGVRSYWPSSPSSSYNEVSNHSSGDEHDWRVWFQRAPFKTYEEKVPRFISEYGLQSWPDPKTSRYFAGDTALDMDHPVMRHRQRSKMPYIRRTFDGNDMILYYVNLYYPNPKNFEELTFFSQLTQARAIRTATEAHRRNMPYTMGSMFWQIDDCWPTMSWASVDYFGLWKAAHYAARSANEDILLSYHLDKRRLTLTGVSDLRQDLEGELRLQLHKFNGDTLWADTLAATLAANTSTLLFESDVYNIIRFERRTGIVLEASLHQEGKQLSRTLFYLTKPKNLLLPQPQIRFFVEGSRAGNKYKITLESLSFAKNIWLRTDSTYGHFSDNFFDMLPGEKRVIQYDTRGKNVPDLEKELRLSTLADYYRK
ncbi:MAG: glycoside hydrolase family 2 protein [Bacteroidota bacterium]